MRFRLSFVMSFAALAACSSSGTEPPPVPARLDVVSGADQQGFLGQALPAALVVRVSDASGRAVSGAAVQWSANGGTVSAASSTTDAAGLARIDWTLGSLPVETATATVA